MALAEAALSTPSIVVVGSNHEYAPVEVREQLAFAGDALTDGLRALNVHVDEGFILSTCNRTEIYIATGNEPQGHREIFEFLSGYHSVPMAMLERAAYSFAGAAAVEHLFRVAAGLDSMVLGEPQILSQIRDALHTAREARSVGPMLHRLATDALRVGKRARTETDISRNRLSIAHAAVELTSREVEDLAGKSVAVIGAGKMATLAAKLLRTHGVRDLTIINRSLAGARRLAEAVHGDAATMDRLPTVLAAADVVIAAVAADAPVVLPRMIPERTSPLLLVDLSVPRAIAAACETVPGVSVRDVDSLEALAEAARSAYAGEIAKVEVLVGAAVDDFEAWQRSRLAVDAIARVRGRADTIRDTELERALRKLAHLNDRDLNVVRALASGISNKLVHEPVQALRRAGTLSELRQVAATQGVDVPGPDDEPSGECV